MKERWPSILLITGIVLVVLGLSGFKGYEAPVPNAPLPEMLSPYYSGHGAYFPLSARIEMSVGSGLIAIGLVGRRDRTT